MFIYNMIDIDIFDFINIVFNISYGVALLSQYKKVLISKNVLYMMYDAFV